MGFLFPACPSTASNRASPRCPWGGSRGGLEGLEVFPAYQFGCGVVGGCHHLFDFLAGHTDELEFQFDLAGGELVRGGHALRLSALWTLGKLFFLHCRFIFSAYPSPMTFAESLAEFSAAEIVAALGCPRQTAYAWLDGTRQPPEWQQALFLAAIRRKTKRRDAGR